MIIIENQNLGINDKELYSIKESFFVVRPVFMKNNALSGLVQFQALA